MKSLTRLACISLIAASLLAACASPIGTRAPGGSGQPLGATPPALTTSSDKSTGSIDPQAEALDQTLTGLENQLNSFDTLEDFK